MKSSKYSRRCVKACLFALLTVHFAHFAWSAIDPALAVSVMRTNTSLILWWTGYTGATYQVESSSTVSGWTNIGPVFTGAGGLLAFTNSTVPKGPGLFRV